MTTKQKLQYYRELESIGPFSVREIIRERREKYGENNNTIVQYLKALDRKYIGISQR